MFDFNEEDELRVERMFECKGVRILFSDPIVDEDAYFSDDESVYDAAYHAARDGYKVNEAVVLDLLGKLFDNETTAVNPRTVEYNISEVPNSAEQAECFAAASYDCDRLNQEVLQQIVSLAPAVTVEVLHGFMEVGYDSDGEGYTDGSDFQGELLETFYYENGILLEDGSNQVEKLIPQGWDYCYNKTLFKWGCYN